MAAETVADVVVVADEAAANAEERSAPMSQPKHVADVTTPLAGGGPIIRKLDNGLTVLMEPLPYLRSVSTGVWIKAGSANEVPSRAGISHFLEHLLFKGTTSRTARDIVECIESRGGQINAFTSRDYTCVYAKTLDAQVFDAIEVLGDIVQDSQMFDFEKERNVILEEIASSEDSPEDLVHELHVRKLWSEDSIGSPIAGTAQTVSDTTVDDVRAYFTEQYRPENMVVAVAGKFDPDEVFNRIGEHFGGLTAGFQASELGSPTYSTGMDLHQRDIGQHHIAVAFEGPSATDDDRYIHSMLSSTLGGGSTSRLFEQIREQEGLAYSIYAYSSHAVQAGMMGIYAAVAPENCAHTLDLIGRELRELRDKPVPEDELESNRQQFKGGLFMSLESTFNRMTRLAKSTLLFGRIPEIDEIVSAIDAVTVEQIQHAAGQLYQADKPLVTVLGPEIELPENVLAL